MADARALSGQSTLIFRLGTPISLDLAARAGRPYSRVMPSVPRSGRAVRVLIADDQRLFAESLMTVLSEDQRVEVVGIAANGEEGSEARV